MKERKREESGEERLGKNKKINIEVSENYVRGRRKKEKDEREKEEKEMKGRGEKEGR